MAKSLEQRLLRRIKHDITTDCWIWQGAKNNIGYGMIRDGAKMRTTHRVSHELFNGDIPQGLCVMHSCDTPACVNPDHLSVGTHTDNMKDMYRKNRKNPSAIADLPNLTCPHCNKTGRYGPMKRWHFNNCKFKK